jgi:hypothetical protein
MKKLFLPFSLVLLLVSCGDTETKTKSEKSLTACECKEIYDNNPTNNRRNVGKNRDSLSKLWTDMWEPCTGFDKNMDEVLKCP